MTKIINNKSEIFCAIARIGSEQSIVDNFHKGGMGVKVDMIREVLIGNGIIKDMQEVSFHLITNIQF